MTDAWQPLLVLVSGAPGAGKTTLAAALAVRLGVLHINRDAVNNGLRLSIDRGAPATLGQRGVAATFGTLEHLSAAGVSVVTDGTLFPDMAASVRRLRDFADVVNIHCIASGWRERFADRQRERGATSEQLAYWDVVFDEWGDSIVDPLDLSCLRVDVRTDNGFDPTLDDVTERLLGAPAHPRVTGGVGPAPNPVAGVAGAAGS